MRALLMLSACCAAMVLSACNRHALKPDLPGAGAVVKPEIVYVDRYIYVPIKPELTREEPIAEGPLSQCPDVGAARKAALKRINARVREIGQVQGTEAQK